MGDQLEPELDGNKTKNIFHDDVLNMKTSDMYPIDGSMQVAQKGTSNSSSDDVTACSSTEKNDAQKPTVKLLHSAFNVLVVDDVSSNRKLLGTLLQKRNATVDMAVDGIDAVEKVLSRDNISHYHLIFLDNTMPRMTGLQCAKELREAGYANLIIGVTGNTMEEELVEFSNVGADLVLTKPMKLSQLDIILRYSEDNGVKSQYIRGMNLFMDDEKIIICPKNSSSTINQANMKLKLRKPSIG